MRAVERGGRSCKFCLNSLVILLFNNVINAVTMDQEILLWKIEEREEVGGGEGGGKKRSRSVVNGMNGLDRVNYTS